MRKIVLLGLALLVFVVPVAAQTQAEREAEIKRAVPYSTMLREFPTLTLLDYNNIVRELAASESRRQLRAPAVPEYVQPSYRTPPAVPRPPVFTSPTYVPPPVTVPYPTYTPPVYEPRSGSAYDWRSGNSYRWNTDPSGTTRLNGNNFDTGSTWRTTIKPDGSMRGMDSNFNPWTYDARTKTYMNLGTGKMCVGEGAARVCY